MDVADIQEHPDGSATMEVVLTKEELRLFVQVGMMTILRDYIENEETNEDDE